LKAELGGESRGTGWEAGSNGSQRHGVAEVASGVRMNWGAEGVVQLGVS